MLSKKEFKKIVKKACRVSSFSYLLKEKSKLRKGKDIEYDQLQTQNYLMPGYGLNSDSMKKIFMIRSRNLDIKCNFPGKYLDKKCVANDCEGNDSQIHLYYCQFLEKENSLTHYNPEDETPYTEIFHNNVEAQYEVMKRIMRKFTRRNEILSSNKPEDPS